MASFLEEVRVVRMVRQSCWSSGVMVALLLQLLSIVVLMLLCSVI